MNPEIWELSDCAKAGIESASINDATNPNPTHRASGLLLVLIIF
jgi:hypothetical protein